MEFDGLNEVLGLASNAVGVTGQAAATLKTFKSLFEGGKSPDTQRAIELLNTLASQLTAANVSNVQLSETLRMLSSEIRRQDEFASEKARYVLFETAEHDIVYKLRDEFTEGQPAHFVCPVCLNRDKLFSYLAGEGDFKSCQTIRDHVFRFKNTPSRHRSRRVV